jgi:hypothetical protein
MGLVVMLHVTVDSAMAASQNGFCSFPSEETQYYSEYDKNINIFIIEQS